VLTKSKLGQSVTLSSTEAEQFALSEVGQEILFTKQLFKSNGIQVELPIIITVDNVEAIFWKTTFQ
jgi:hypothetical protein